MRLLPLLIALAALAGAADLAVGGKAPVWSLPDASDAQHNSSEFAHRTLLIIGGDKKSQESNNVWGERVRNSCPSELSIVAIADTSAVPRLLRGYYKNQFRAEAMRMGVPFLLDWNGTFARDYHFKPDVSNVFLIGPENTVIFLSAGPTADEAVKQLCAAAKGR